LFLLGDELQEVADESLEAAGALGAGIAELDGEATGDPTLLVERIARTRRSRSRA